MANISDIFCPICDKVMGSDPTTGASLNVHSMMVKTLVHDDRMDGMFYKCTAMSHTLDYDRLMAMKPRMKKLIVREKQPGNTIAQTIWVHPEAWSVLARKFPNNLMTTMCALLTALADGDTFIVEGEHARELLSLGIDRGHGVVGLAKTNQMLKSEVEELTAKLRGYESKGGKAGGAGAAIPDLTPAQVAAIQAIFRANGSPQTGLIDPNDPDAVGKEEQRRAMEEEFSSEHYEQSEYEAQVPGGFPSAAGGVSTGLATKFGMPRLGGNGPSDGGTI